MLLCRNVCEWSVLLIAVARGRGEASDHKVCLSLETAQKALGVIFFLYIYAVAKLLKCLSAAAVLLVQTSVSLCPRGVQSCSPERGGIVSVPSVNV